MTRSIVILLLFCTSTAAHDLYPLDCCNGQDCKTVPCAEIEATGTMWRYGGVTFLQNNVRKPIDSRCHVCAAGSIGRCIMFPQPRMS